MRVVVDASVAVKWFFPEAGSQGALRLLEGEPDLLAPDLIRAEVGNVLWKKWRRSEIEEQEAGLILRDFKRLPLQICSSEPLTEAAWELAHTLERSFYDSLYLALAILAECPLVTADAKLYNALQIHSARSYLVWVDDVP